MNLAVRLWSDMPSNPESIPGVWPAEVHELGEGTTLPTPGTWQLMTLDSFNAYKASHQSTYDAWKLAKDFQTAMADKLAKWDIETRDYIYQHYPQEKQQSIVLLLVLANLQGLTNRFNYLMQAVDWVMNQVLTHHYTKVAEYAACTTVAELEAVAGDFQQFDSTDPLVGLSDAMAIPD